jgi:UDP-N-acetyl-D-galactosamine dehydrogenase
VNGIDIIYGAKPVLEDYSAIILAVGHQEFKSWDIRKSDQKVLYDMKGLLSKKLVDARL